MMITAETLRKCANLSSIHLEKLIRKNYPKDMVIQSEFVGVTNASQFCYKISFPDDNSKTGLGQGKIFVWIDDNGNVIADY